MKHILIIAAACITIAACTSQPTPQQQAEQLDRYSERFSACMETDNLDSAQIYHQYNTAIRDSITAETSTYKGQHNGWKVTHTFRAANRLGAINLDSATFYLDKELTHITQMK